MMWSERVGNLVFVFHNGAFVYKRKLRNESGDKAHSALFNKSWPSVQINTSAEEQCAPSRPATTPPAASS